MFVKKAILRTLAYADVFDYSLTAPEIGRFLITPKKVNQKLIQKALDLPSVAKGYAGGAADQKKQFYFLSGRQQTILLRKKRKNWSQKKLKIAQKVAQWLKLIPTIKMVAVTGALAMMNARQDDDIDFLIVTSHGRLWLTRLATVFLVELVAQRRRPASRRVKDKICLNMFLDEAHLEVPSEEQDLFSAHEVCQLKPLWDRDKIYQKFIFKNQWFKKYLANWKP